MQGRASLLSPLMASPSYIFKVTFFGGIFIIKTFLIFSWKNCKERQVCTPPSRLEKCIVPHLSFHELTPLGENNIVLILPLLDCHKVQFLATLHFIYKTWPNCLIFFYIITLDIGVNNILYTVYCLAYNRSKKWRNIILRKFL